MAAEQEGEDAMEDVRGCLVLLIVESLRRPVQLCCPWHGPDPGEVPIRPVRGAMISPPILEDTSCNSTAGQARLLIVFPYRTRHMRSRRHQLHPQPDRRFFQSIRHPIFGVHRKNILSCLFRDLKILALVLSPIRRV